MPSYGWACCVRLHGSWEWMPRKGRPNEIRKLQSQPVDPGPTALLPCVKFRKLLPKTHDLGRIVIDDVRAVRMSRRIILVIGLCRIKILESDYLSHNRTSKDLRF